MSLNVGCCGRERATDHLQQRGFTATVTTENADGFTFFNFKGNVLNRPKFPKILFRVLSCHALQTRRDKLL
jgi:hypothetical protein